jgi:hypothetical protein
MTLSQIDSTETADEIEHLTSFAVLKSTSCKSLTRNVGTAAAYSEVRSLSGGKIERQRVDATDAKLLAGLV